MAHWLAVTTADNWSRCLATKTWGVEHQFQGLIQRTEVGDEGTRITRAIRHGISAIADEGVQLVVQDIIKFMRDLSC